MAKSFLGMLLALAACAPIYVRETAVDTAIASRLDRDIVADSVAYTAAARVHGDVIALELSQAERCAEIETPRAHRVTRVERHLDARVMSTIWVIGGLFSFAGVYGYVDADRIATTQNQSGMGMMTTPGDVRNAGIVGMAIGGMALLAIAGNHLRAIDSQRDDGAVSGPPVRRDYACNQHSTAGTRVALDLGDATLRGDTDDVGRVEFALTDVPLAAFPRRGPLGVVIDGRRARVDLADNELAELRRTIQANPASRLARDLQALCDAGIAEADAMLSGAPRRDRLAGAAAALQHAAAQCTAPAQVARVNALSAQFGQRQKALDDEEALAARQRGEPRDGLEERRVPVPPQATPGLLTAACGGNNAYKVTVGYLVCMAPMANDICANATEAGLRYIGHRIVAGLGLGLLPRAAADAAVDTGAALAAPYIGDVCRRMLAAQELPAAPAQGMIPCLLAARQPSWIAPQCRALGHN
jgi:hypothetical protein